MESHMGRKKSQTFGEEGSARQCDGVKSHLTEPGDEYGRFQV